MYTDWDYVWGKRHSSFHMQWACSGGVHDLSSQRREISKNCLFSTLRTFSPPNFTKSRNLGAKSSNIFQVDILWRLTAKICISVELGTTEWVASLRAHAERSPKQTEPRYVRSFPQRRGLWEPGGVPPYVINGKKNASPHYREGQYARFVRRSVKSVENHDFGCSSPCERNKKSGKFGDLQKCTLRNKH
ncbi:hypothetical protein K440DRAFT_643223 [Wilcoxina mikolae CBS 423.85]|nr:hypothetical protein K440DRAFT_643223 [Wilcoxina mikolae CBS 423.85]